MNKGELIQKLAGRMGGDQKMSSKAVDAVVNEIELAVSSGEKVNITGFGVFEKRDRAARTGRNPRTGEPINVKKTTVPAFRAGQSFKTLVAGGGGGGRSQAGRGQSARAHGGRGQTAYAQSAYQQPGQPRGQAKRTQSRAQASQPARAQRAQTSRAQAPRAQSRASTPQAGGATARRPSASRRAK